MQESDMQTFDHRGYKAILEELGVSILIILLCKSKYLYSSMNSIKKPSLCARAI